MVPTINVSCRIYYTIPNSKSGFTADPLSCKSIRYECKGRSRPRPRSIVDELLILKFDFGITRRRDAAIIIDTTNPGPWWIFQIVARFRQGFLRWWVDRCNRKWRIAHTTTIWLGYTGRRLKKFFIYSRRFFVCYFFWRRDQRWLRTWVLYRFQWQPMAWNHLCW